MRLRVLIPTVLALLALSASSALGYISPAPPTARAIKTTVVKTAHRLKGLPKGDRVTAVAVQDIRLSTDRRWASAFVFECFSAGTPGCTLMTAPTHGEGYQSILKGHGTSWKQVAAGSDGSEGCAVPQDQRKSLGITLTPKECREMYHPHALLSASPLCSRSYVVRVPFDGRIYPVSESCADYINLAGKRLPGSESRRTFPQYAHSGGVTIVDGHVHYAHTRRVGSITLAYRPRGHGNWDNAGAGSKLFTLLAPDGAPTLSDALTPYAFNLTQQSSRVFTYDMRSSNPNGSGRNTQLIYLIRITGGYATASASVRGWINNLRPNPIVLNMAEHLSGVNRLR